MVRPAYGEGVSRLGRAPPCPCGGDRRWRPLAPSPGGGNGAHGPEGVGSPHLLMRSGHASVGGGEAFVGATCCRPPPPPPPKETLGATISGHRRRGFAGGEQRVACRPIRTEPVSTAHCVPRAPQRAVSNCCSGPISGQLSAGVAGSVQTRHCALLHLGN